MKVILYMAITVNGLIAREDDSVDWVSEDSWASYQKIIKKAGCAIIGRRTHELMPPEEFLKECLYIVLTHDKSRKSAHANVIFTTQGPNQVLNFLADKGFKEVCICGGGGVNSSFIRLGLIDEIYLDVEPIVFGKGIQLFSPEDFEVKFQLLEIKKLNQNTVQLHYQVKR